MHCFHRWNIDIICECLVSYPNFIRGQLFFDMRPPFDHFKMFNTHCHGILKVLGHFGKKTAKNTKTGGALRKLHPEHSRRGVNLSITGCIQESCSRSLWAATTSILLKNGIWDFRKNFENLELAYFT